MRFAAVSRKVESRHVSITHDPALPPAADATSTG
jgi:hypothetical protein